MINFDDYTNENKKEHNWPHIPDVDMLLMVENGIREGICHAIHRYANTNNKYVKNYDKNK